MPSFRQSFAHAKWTLERICSVVPYLSIGPIGQLAHFFFSAVRQFRRIDQLVPN
jgi:hypothetical protein